jgi:3-carboxy-cis,cis-muconate cycloisomerase
MQTEVGEVLEPAAPGKGGSSTMPHKRNPVGCAVVLAAATRMPGLAATLLAAMGQEHERGLGGWHAEWETLPDMFKLTAGALSHMAEIVEGLEVRPVRLRANLEATQGLLMAEAVAMALGRSLGKTDAHACLEAACKRAITEGRHLRDVVLADEAVRRHLSAAEVRALFEPGNYLGVSRDFIGRALAEWRSAGSASARRSARKGTGGRARRKKP